MEGFHPASSSRSPSHVRSVASLSRSTWSDTVPMLSRGAGWDWRDGPKRIDSAVPARVRRSAGLQLPPHAGATLRGKRQDRGKRPPRDGQDVEPWKTLAGVGRARRVRLDRLLSCPEQRVCRLGRPLTGFSVTTRSEVWAGSRSVSPSRRSRAASTNRWAGCSRASPTNSSASTREVITWSASSSTS